MAAASAELGERQCRKWRLGRGLEHETAAGRQRRPRLARDHRGGKVPRCDGGNHADRLAQDHDALVALMAGDDVAIQPLALFGKPFDEGCGVGDFPFRFGQRFALLGRHQDRQILLVLQHQFVPTTQDDRTILCGTRRPGRQGLGGRGDGAPRLCSAHVGDDTERFRSCRVVYRERAAAVGRHPAPIDEALLSQQQRIR
jgi:hypothetical protein